MNEMTVPSTHKIRKSGLKGHEGSPQNWIFTSEHFVSLKREGQSEARTRDLRLSKQAALITAPGPLSYFEWNKCKFRLMVNATKP